MVEEAVVVVEEAVAVAEEAVAVVEEAVAVEEEGVHPVDNLPPRPRPQHQAHLITEGD